MAEFATRYGATPHHFGGYDHIDWWLEKDGRTVAYAEVKRRYNDREKYPTIFLAFRKWLALFVSHAYTGVPALFVVGWDDSIGWLDVSSFSVNPLMLTIGGRSDRPDAKNDREPIIEVPISDMRVL